MSPPPSDSAASATPTSTAREGTHPGSGLPGFLRGATYPLRGVAFLARRRSAWPYAVVPGLVNLFTLLGFLALAFFYVDELAALLRPEFLEAAPVAGAAAAEGGGAAALLAKLGDSAGSLGRHALRALLFVVAMLLAAVGAVAGALLTAAILAGPFQEKLSEVIESLATGRPAPDEPLSLRTLTMDARRAVGGALRRVGLFGIVYVPLLMLSLIPVVGLVGAAGTVVYSAFFMALNFMDPTLERRKLPLRRKLGYARASIGPWFGFGGALLALILVPFVGILLTPAFVTGGVLLWLDLGGLDAAPDRPPAG